MLDILARRNLRATFFVIEVNKLAQPERRVLAERAHAGGHWIGNHSYTHSIPVWPATARPDRFGKCEIRRTQKLKSDALAVSSQTVPSVLAAAAISIAAFVQQRGRRLSQARALYLRAVEFHSARLGRSRGLGRGTALSQCQIPALDINGAARSADWRDADTLSSSLDTSLVWPVAASVRISRLIVSR